MGRRGGVGGGLEAALAPQAPAALAPTAQAAAPVPVSSKLELGKAYRVILPVPTAARPRQAAPQGTSPQPGRPGSGWVGGGEDISVQTKCSSRPLSAPPPPTAAPRGPLALQD